MRAFVVKSSLLFFLVLFNHQILAGGGTFCNAVASGLWSESTTWSCNTGSGIPESSSSVDIEAFTVTLDVDAAVRGVNVDNGATLVVANTLSGLTLQWSSTSSDLASGFIDLQGDLNLVGIGASQSIRLGTIDGAFALSVTALQEIELQGEVGAVTPLSSLVLSTPTLIQADANTTTTGSQDFLGELEVNSHMTITASVVTFQDNVFSLTQDLNPNDLTINGDAVFQSNIDASAVNSVRLGNDFRLNDLTVSGSTTTEAAVTAINTNGTQLFSGGLNINNDTTLTSDNGDIRITGSGGAHNLVVTANGVINLRGDIGNPRHQSVTTNATSFLEIRGGGSGTDIMVDGSGATTFNNNIRVGASGDLLVDQIGAGDVVFNGSLFLTGGGPKTLTVNDVSGQTIFNGNINLGQVTTNDGTGDDVTIINASAVTTNQGGSTNGRMTFNDPVRIATDVTFRENGAGRIRFNNSVDALNNIDIVNVNIESDNEVILGPVGTINTLSTLSTDAGGSTSVSNRVWSELNITFNDDVTLTENTSISSELVTFNESVDLQNFDLNLSAIEVAANGVISGSGNITSSTDDEFELNAENTFTGNLFVSNGDLDLSNALTENNISSANQIVLSSSSTIKTSNANSVFELKSGQTLAGTGTIVNNLSTASGSVLSPGNSPGTIDGGDLNMQTGSIFEAEVGGVISGLDSDLLRFSDIDLDADLGGGAELMVITTAPVQVGDAITIVQNNFAGAVAGTFNGLSEGDTVGSQGPGQYTISYVGGDGNDVVLTVVDTCSSTTFVTSNADSGAGTLREAIDELCAGGEILFSADMTVTLASEIAIDKQVTIDGNGFDVALSGNNATRLFNIGLFGDLSLLSMSIINGYSIDSGGAIFNGGRLFVQNSTFDGNVSDHPTAAGGAIFTESGRLSVAYESTFINNDGIRGGAVYLENGMFPGSFVTFNSTFTQNGASSTQGGAIYNSGSVLARNNTFAANGNQNSEGDSLYTNNGFFTLENNILADGLGGDDCFINLNNSTEDNTANLIETGNCDATLTDDPRLMALADNGGPTLTMALQPSSPAIDAGDADACLDTDQRGVARPQLAACDLGAYESLVTTYNIGGTISGLANGGEVTLQNNGGDDLVITANGVFAFATELDDTDAYAVQVSVQPSAPNQVCSVSNGSGTISAADVTDITVTCVTETYTIGGTLSGLVNGNSVTLQLNGGNDLVLSSNEAFTFDNALDDGTEYDIIVGTQPSLPQQTCVVTDGSGTLSGANVTNVSVTCTVDQFTIGGDLSGLANGNSVTLQNNGGNDLIITDNGSFEFTATLADTIPYEVTVTSQPSTPNQVCSVSNGSGIVAADDVTNVVVTCVTETHAIGGSLTGLVPGNSITLQNNAGDDLLISANGAFTFSNALDDGSMYDVTILTPPTSPQQSCVVTNGSGTLVGANVTNVTISCTVDEFFVGGDLVGLANGNSVTLQNLGGDDLILNSNGPFVFDTTVPDTIPYEVTVSKQPTSPNQACTVNNGTGTIPADDVTDISVLCVTVQYSVGGFIFGLNPGSVIELELNSNGPIEIDEEGPFVFPTPLDDLSTFDVQIISEPSSPIQNCQLFGGSGTIEGDDEIDVEIFCDNNDLIFKDGFDMDPSR